MIVLFLKLIKKNIQWMILEYTVRHLNCMYRVFKYHIEWATDREKWRRKPNGWSYLDKIFQIDLKSNEWMHALHKTVHSAHWIFEYSESRIPLPLKISRSGTNYYFLVSMSNVVAMGPCILQVKLFMSNSWWFCNAFYFDAISDPFPLILFVYFHRISGFE